MHGIMSSPVESSGFHWTPLDFDWTLSPLDWDWTFKSGLQSSGSPVDWTGLDWALYQPIWPGKMSTEIQWSPVESIWIMWGRVKTSMNGTVDTVEPTQNLFMVHSTQEGSGER